ncbi:hypothetical protein V7149_20925 [Bacillus sp. JJ1503]|uniref:hypothetical protein n=1 Tax=Bacillus sp. JJ1503 TaxID=3122956 RepID=UPI002FFDD192
MKKIKAAVSILFAVISLCYCLVVYKKQKNEFYIISFLLSILLKQASNSPHLHRGRDLIYYLGNLLKTIQVTDKVF